MQLGIIHSLRVKLYMFMLEVRVQVAPVCLLQFLLDSMVVESVTTAMQVEEQQVVVAGVHVLSPGQRVTLFQPVGTKP